eukprot:m.227363 g.227363  ORF g.227363 m.227363 type:complete len:219 (+) comp22369_c1_seq1:818-1474(+)
MAAAPPAAVTFPNLGNPAFNAVCGQIGAAGDGAVLNPANPNHQQSAAKRMHLVTKYGMGHTDAELAAEYAAYNAMLQAAPGGILGMLGAINGNIQAVQANQAAMQANQAVVQVQLANIRILVRNLHRQQIEGQPALPPLPLQKERPDLGAVAPAGYPPAAINAAMGTLPTDFGLYFPASWADAITAAQLDQLAFFYGVAFAGGNMVQRRQAFFDYLRM